MLELVRPAAGSQADQRDRVLAEIVEQTYRETNASGAALALDVDGQVVCCARAGECSPRLGAELDREAGISGLCLRTAEMVRCNDAANDARVDCEAAGRLGISSILAVPIALNHATVGLLEVFSASPDAFGIPEEASVFHAAQRLAAVLGGEPERGMREDDWDSLLQMLSEPTVCEPVASDAFGAAIVSDASVLSDTVAPVEDVSLAACGPEPAPERVGPPEPGEKIQVQSIASDDSVPEAAPKRRLMLFVGGLALIAVGALALSIRSGNTAPRKSFAVVEKLRNAAQQGQPAAQVELARHYQAGEGIKRNDVEAVRWLREAARQGDADAQYELGNAYADGKGVAADIVSAYACYVLAGAKGNTAGDEALRRLTPQMTSAQIAQVRSTVGEMFLEGRGTPVDYVGAYAWFRLAESAGSSDGRSARRAVASKMTKQQIAAAERRASDWLKHHG